MRPGSALAALSFCAFAILSCPAAAADEEWCAHVAGGPSGTRPLPVDLSAAHVGVRLFGPEGSCTLVDQMLADALETPDALQGAGAAALGTYAASLESVCLVAGDNRPFPKASVW